ncbi:MAG: hypothetical protein AAF389_03365 [Gemmatimonadota bacterium]
MNPRLAAVAIVVVALAAGAMIRTASSRASATFDEIVLVGGGVRGVTTGEWGMITDQPPLPMLLYGWAAAPAADVRPPEDRSWTFDDRWDYARALHFGAGNDPQRVLGRARWVTTLLAVILIAGSGAFAWWAASAAVGPAVGASAGLLASVLTATMPDVLAHGGVAYNDLPLACAFLFAVWALDVLVRKPTVVSGATAGLAVAISFGMKMSALALGPIAVVLLGLEAWSRRVERGTAGLMEYLRASSIPIGTSLVTAWATLAVLYRGDPTLTLFRFNVWRTIAHASGGHPAPAYLMGSTSAEGWWYYFPVAFLFKTPVVLHLLIIGAIGWAAYRVRTPGGGDAIGLWASSFARAPLLGLGVFAAFLMRSDLNAGFRYALPVLPLISVCVAVGAAGWWRTRARAAVLVALSAQTVLVWSAWPHFLSWSSVWAGPSDAIDRPLSDSNADWGQGLLELRDFMAEEDVETVRLSYFGSARPEAYGIDYVALPSFFRLVPERTAAAEADPRFTVISVTNLHGLYLQGRDPFAAYRVREPYRVLAGALYVFGDDP